MGKVGNLLVEQFEAVAQRQSKSKLPLPDDEWQFLMECGFTQDEHAREKGLPYVRSFPQDKPYLEAVARSWQREPRLRIEKSRQIMITWLMSGLHLAAALKNPGERIAWQSKKFEDSDAILRDRLWFMYLQIPAQYEKPRARYLSGAIEVFHTSSPIPSSQIMAIAQGEAQLRQYTFSRVVSDESAFQEQQESSYGAMRPTIDGGGRVTILSSANGENFFWQLGHKDVGQG